MKETMNDNQHCITGEYLEDEELGTVMVRVNSRASRLIFHGADGGLVVTVPRLTKWGKVRQALDELRPRLRVLAARTTRHLITPRFRIDADYFHLAMIASDTKKFQLRTNPVSTTILYPHRTDFSDPSLQEWLKKVVTEALRDKAQTVLPPLLAGLAQRHGLTYREVRINTSTGRWGSCSTRQSINLSCRLLLLPRHLIEYVLLHELAHTREMNHGDRFWALLDSMTDGKARGLRSELRHFPTPI